MRRRVLTGGMVLAAAILGGGKLWRNWNQSLVSGDGSWDFPEPPVVDKVGRMPYRAFGSTGLKVSEVGFGSWGIGSKAYGPVDRTEALRALAIAQELGCNFVDTAGVYGDSELVLGEFLQDRRDRWIVSTKYSKQPAGMTTTLEDQLRRLKTDYVDFYMIHWVPRGDEQSLYDELYALRKSGKARFVGVSLYTHSDVDYVLDHQDIDGVMVPFSLLDPEPYLARRKRLRQSGKAVVVRSSLKEGFLAGNFKRDTMFTDPDDQRSQWSREQIKTTVDRVEQFRPLAWEAGSMIRLALGYPLSFPEVSTVVVGAKSASHVESNFGVIPGTRLSLQSLESIGKLQDAMGLRGQRSWRGIIKRLLGR